LQASSSGGCLEFRTAGTLAKMLSCSFGNTSSGIWHWSLFRLESHEGKRYWDLCPEFEGALLVLQAEIEAGCSLKFLQILKPKRTIGISHTTMAPCQGSQSTQVHQDCSPHLGDKWFSLNFTDEGNKSERKVMFHQGHTTNWSHWSTVCHLVCRGYNEDIKNTFSL